MATSSSSRKGLVSVRVAPNSVASINGRAEFEADGAVTKRDLASTSDRLKSGIQKVGAPILATKLYIPPPRPKVVLRHRLIEKLDEGLHSKLTLISAPAGFGKTTLAAVSWPRRSR